MGHDETTEPRSRLRWPVIAFGAALFAAALTLGPILATSGVDAGGSSGLFAAGNTGMLVAREVSAIRATAPAAPPSTVPEMVAAPSTTLPPAIAAPAEPSAAPAEPEDGGSVAITLDPAAPEPFGDGAAVGWEITVANDGDEYLWGVFAYLEGRGRVDCDDRQLDVGASTTCRAELQVWADVPTATAWVTAWTVNRMVDAEASYPVLVEG